MGIFKKKEEVKDFNLTQEQVDTLDQDSKKALWEYLSSQFEGKEQLENKTLPTDDSNVSNDTNDKVQTQPEENKQDTETSEKVDESVVENAQQDNGVVEESEETQDQEAIGYSLADVVTKDKLEQYMAGFQAKLDSIIKENADLKEKLAQKDSQVNDLKDKYENGDFGVERNNKVETTEKTTYESYSDYMKKFAK